MKTKCNVCMEDLGRTSNIWVHTDAGTERVCLSCKTWFTKWRRFFERRNLINRLFPIEQV